jgi:type II secretory pathway pseudopilin PulG
MAALLVGLSIMAVLMSAALPVWSHFAKREKEEELIWRGQQYARAIGLFQRKYANTYPPTLDILLEQRFLRKKYKDPITNDDFQLIPAGGPAAPLPGGQQQQPPVGQQPQQGGRAGSVVGGSQPAPQTLGGRGGVPNFQPAIGIQGVVSKSKESSIKVFNGRSKYNEWTFIYLATAQRIGIPGQVPQPGQPPRPGQQQPGQMQFGGTTFTPLGGSERRPGVGGPPGPGGGQRPPFGQPPFGQPPFGQPPFGPAPPDQGPFGRPPVPPPPRPPG